MSQHTSQGEGRIIEYRTVVVKSQTSSEFQAEMNEAIAQARAVKRGVRRLQGLRALYDKLHAEKPKRKIFLGMHTSMTIWIISALLLVAGLTEGSYWNTGAWLLCGIGTFCLGANWNRVQP